MCYVLKQIRKFKQSVNTILWVLIWTVLSTDIYIQNESNLRLYRITFLLYTYSNWHLIQLDNNYVKWNIIFNIDLSFSYRGCTELYIMKSLICAHHVRVHSESDCATLSFYIIVKFKALKASYSFSYCFFSLFFLSHLLMLLHPFYALETMNLGPPKIRN